MLRFLSQKKHQSIFEMDDSFFINSFFMFGCHSLAGILEFWVRKVRKGAPESILHHFLPSCKGYRTWIGLQRLLDTGESSLFQILS
mmetsp:Transcript_39977/g.114953  ORF Transcript_39977/g.114953 Transcript_39977/m.114953 type:complete len:86 (-) Transcript_39977:123-380(-)